MGLEGTRVRVRPFRPSDAASCSAIIRACLPLMDGLNEAARRLVTEKTMPHRVGREFAELDAAVVAERGGAIVGLGGLAGAEIKRVYVDPAHHRAGVGTALMAALERMAARRGVAEVVVAASPNAVAFYERRGYRWAEVQRLTSGEAIFDVIVMTKRLDRARVP